MSSLLFSSLMNQYIQQIMLTMDTSVFLSVAGFYWVLLVSICYFHMCIRDLFAFVTTLATNFLSYYLQKHQTANKIKKLPSFVIFFLCSTNLISMLSDLPLYLQPWNFINLLTDIGWSLHVISKHVESSYLLFIDMEPHIFFLQCFLLQETVGYHYCKFLC